MQAYIFPGQGAQFEGMGAELFNRSETAKKLFRDADDILGIPLSKLMRNGNAEALTPTKIAQPANPSETGLAGARAVFTR